MNTTAYTTEAMADLVNSFRQQVFIERDLTAIDDYLTSDFVDHFAPPHDAPGRDGVRHRFSQAAVGFHTEGVDVLHQFEQGDMLCQVISIRMRHTGEFMGQQATDMLVRVGGFDAFRIRAGRLHEHWGVYDVSKLAEAVGVGPASWGEMWHD